MTNTNQKFNNLLKSLKKSRGARQAVADEAVKIALNDINTSNNSTKLNVLVLGDFLENNEIKLIRDWIVSESNITGISVGKSATGNKTVKVQFKGDKIEFKTDSKSLYDYQLQKKEIKIQPFTDENLIDSIFRLLKKSEKAGLYFSNALKEAKKKAVKD